MMRECKECMMGELPKLITQTKLTNGLELILWFNNKEETGIAKASSHLQGFELIHSEITKALINAVPCDLKRFLYSLRYKGQIRSAKVFKKVQSLIAHKTKTHEYVSL